VHLVVAENADLRLAPRAVSIFSAMRIPVEIRWLDPLATFRGTTVDSVFGVVFVILPIPQNLEFLVEQLFNMLQGNMIVGTTARWHVCRVFDGHLENAF